MALHLEDAGETVANVDDAGVFARALNDDLAGDRQRLQVHLRGFVRAMLVPHCGEDAELGDRGLASDQFQNPLVLVGLQAMFGDEFGRDLDGVGNIHAASRTVLMLSNRPRPSVGPIAGST